MQDIDKLLNPNKTFLEYQDYLIDLIASSYHKQFKDTVATRIKESLYFFDSLPDITYQTIKNNNSNLKYLYYDYFEKEDDNINNIKKSLINEIKYNWNNKLDDLYETVKIFKKIKN